MIKLIYIYLKKTFMYKNVFLFYNLALLATLKMELYSNMYFQDSEISIGI